MASITDFNTWLEGNDLSDYNDVYSLYNSVANVEEWAGYKTIKGRTEGQYVVSSIECGEDLFLASEKARESFLKTIEEQYCEGMDIEGFYGFHHAMEKDD